MANRVSTGRHGWIDLLYPGQMGVEHKSLGEDLDEAMGQLLDYYTSLSQAEQPWLLIACDFRTWRWHNLRTAVGVDAWVLQGGSSVATIPRTRP